MAVNKYVKDRNNHYNLLCPFSSQRGAGSYLLLSNTRVHLHCMCYIPMSRSLITVFWSKLEIILYTLFGLSCPTKLAGLYQTVLTFALLYTKFTLLIWTKLACDWSLIRHVSLWWVSHGSLIVKIFIWTLKLTVFQFVNEFKKKFPFVNWMLPAPTLCRER